jgi:hypothetical protein
LIAHPHAGSFVNADCTIRTGNAGGNAQQIAQRVHQRQIAATRAIAEEQINAPAWATVEKAVEINDSFDLADGQPKFRCEWGDFPWRNVQELALQVVQAM